MTTITRIIIEAQLLRESGDIAGAIILQTRAVELLRDERRNAWCATLAKLAAEPKPTHFNGTKRALIEKRELAS